MLLNFPMFIADTMQWFHCTQHMFAGGNERDSSSQGMFSFACWPLAPVGVWRPHVGQGEAGLGDWCREDTVLRRTIERTPLALGSLPAAQLSTGNWPCYSGQLCRAMELQSSPWSSWDLVVSVHGPALNSAQSCFLPYPYRYSYQEHAGL